MPWEWARSKRRRHWPLRTFQILILPVWSAVASISLSLLQARASTASSCIMSSSLPWYLRSLRSLAVSGSHTSMNPSMLPETRYWPSGEKAAHSAWDFLPKRIVCVHLVGNSSVSSGFAAAVPRNTSNCVPGGSRPWCCCHFNACPIRTRRRDGGTTLTSVESNFAISTRRDSLFEPPSYASRASQIGREQRCSSLKYRSGCSCFMDNISSVCRSMARATSTSRSSRSSKITCSYKAISFWTGSCRDWHAVSTASQLPAWTSERNPSTLSTVFRATCDSCWSDFRLSFRPFSLQNCNISLTTSCASTSNSAMIASEVLER
mmetsp:Transcript_27629/g.57458  ORF Transcript_27629/g.57458 Transcript_27629/m.57458 type:complete len:320 (+) Transcript_27629:872-1831(+)